MKDVEGSMCKAVRAWDEKNGRVPRAYSLHDKGTWVSQAGGGAGKRTAIHVGVAMLAIG